VSWRVDIVDDEPAARERLGDLCAGVAGLEVAGVHEDLGGALEALAGRRTDILLLDVAMPGGDGFALLDELPEGQRPVVVFVTAHADHAVRAFDRQAVDYLLKPFDAERFGLAIRRAVQQLEYRRGGEVAARLDALLERPAPAPSLARFAVRSPGRVSLLRPEEIEWLDAAGNSVRIHAGGAVHRVRETLGGIERQLDPARFARIHRSTIVNVERVREVLVSPHGDYTLVTDGGRRLTVGRQYRERVQRLLGGGAAPADARQR
jgi:two-component system LytT family response regulator